LALINGSSNYSSITANSIEISRMMGLFNSEKSEKVHNIDNYEEYHDESPSKSYDHSSKYHSKELSCVIIRPTPQLSMMGNNANSFPSNLGYSQTFLANSIPMNPYFGVHPGRTNLPDIWSNRVVPFADRSPFQ